LTDEADFSRDDKAQIRLWWGMKAAIVGED
jgi:hypothetical protein